MSLRIKLLIGYLIFVVALVTLGAWSVWRFREMSDITRYQVISRDTSQSSSDRAR